MGADFLKEQVQATRCNKSGETEEVYLYYFSSMVTLFFCMGRGVLSISIMTFSESLLIFTSYIGHFVHWNTVHIPLLGSVKKIVCTLKTAYLKSAYKSDALG